MIISTDTNYALLTRYLDGCGQDEVKMSFEQLSHIINKLPDYAYKHSTPWYSSGPIANAARKSGYKASVSFTSKTVVFYRNKRSESSNNRMTMPPQSIRNDIPQPSQEVVQHYLDKWGELENYVAQESALRLLFLTLAPTNNSIDSVLIKVTTLNEFYSTRIPFSNIYNVAMHIVNLNIDDRLLYGDESLVRDIANTRWRYEYSFATKYCSHHNTAAYPIYDNYVKMLLCHYRDIDGFRSFHNGDLKDYSVFKKVILCMQEYYSLENYSIKELDRFLWLLGKEKFAKK